MATVKTYDVKCHELAMAFLSDEADLNHERAIHSLALEIQQCIEDEIHFMRQGIFSGSTPDRSDPDIIRTGKAKWPY